MQLRLALLVSLVYVGCWSLAAAQPGLNLPPAGVSGFARGIVEDVRRVGELCWLRCQQAITTENRLSWHKAGTSCAGWRCRLARITECADNHITYAI
jgi:hypothetical protein